MTNVTSQSFDADVIDRSHEVPVVVDFWAPWCGPCHALAPALEREAAARAGIEIVKLNVDEHPDIAARFAIAGIPSVKAFRDGEVVSEFVGALPPSLVARFLDELEAGVPA